MIFEEVSCFISDIEGDMHLNDVISNWNPRTFSEEVAAAKPLEISSLLDRGIFKKALQDKLALDANIFPGSFALAFQSTEYQRTKYEARIITGGHRDKLKHVMFTSASILQPSSIRLQDAQNKTCHFRQAIPFL